VGERISFALERFASPRHSSHVAQLFSLGCIESHTKHDITKSRAIFADYSQSRFGL